MSKPRWAKEDVDVLGIGMTPFGKRQESLKELAVSAAREAIADAGISVAEVDAIYVSNFLGGMLNGQQILGSIVANELGLSGIPTMAVEGACASGGIAFRQAYLNTASGVYDTVLVIGVEKMTARSTKEITLAINSAMDQESWECKAGLTFPGYFGLVANRYLSQYGGTSEDLASVVLKNREFALANQKAQFREPIDIERHLQAKMISSPLGLFDCSPITDGACAVVLTRNDPSTSHSKVRVIASSQASGPTQLKDIEDLTTLSAIKTAADIAYKQANVTPADIDVVELHDCFSITEILSIEDLGFFEKGKGINAVREGKTKLHGIIPVNTSGGLLSKGHPIGATGLAQIYQIVSQLRGTAANQVDGARIGLAENLGGTGAYATVHIFEGVQ
jgi:acetyl-CoA C-acetyltransferase